MTICERAADELGVKLYDYLIAILNEYGEDVSGDGSYLVVSEQILDMLGIEIYIENTKVIEAHKDRGTLFIVTNGVYDYTVVHLNGSIICEY